SSAPIAATPTKQLPRLSRANSNMLVESAPWKACVTSLIPSWLIWLRLCGPRSWKARWSAKKPGPATEETAGICCSRTLASRVSLALGLFITGDRLKYYEPYGKQLEFYAAGAAHRERLLMAGNQLGKTLAGGFGGGLDAPRGHSPWGR